MRSVGVASSVAVLSTAPSMYSSCSGSRTGTGVRVTSLTWFSLSAVSNFWVACRAYYNYTLLSRLKIKLLSRLNISGLLWDEHDLPVSGLGLVDDRRAGALEVRTIDREGRDLEVLLVTEERGRRIAVIVETTEVPQCRVM